MATEQQINECLSMLRAAFAQTLRNATIPAEADAIYTLMLESTPGDVLRAAALKIIATDTWYPTIARVLEACRDVQLAAQPAHDWEQGYMYCRRACRYFGTGQWQSAYAKIAEYDAVAAQTIQRLGWDSFFMCPEADEGIFKAQFRDIYNTVVKREQASLALPQHVAAQIMQVSAALSAQGRIAAPKK